MRKFMILVGALFIIGTTLPTGFLLWHFWPWAMKLPSHQELEVISVEGSPCLTQYHAPLSEIPPIISDVFLSIEDNKFWARPPANPFFDFVRAIVFNEPHTRLGVSDGVSHQIVACMRSKNAEQGNQGWAESVLLMLYRLDRELPKDRILELYLNTIYLGRGAHGIVEGAKVYFDKPLADLTLSQAAFLVSLLRSPNMQCEQPEIMLERRDRVLDTLANNGTITLAEASAAKTEAFKIQPCSNTMVR